MRASLGVFLLILAGGCNTCAAQIASCSDVLKLAQLRLSANEYHDHEYTASEYAKRSWSIQENGEATIPIQEVLTNLKSDVNAFSGKVNSSYNFTHTIDQRAIEFEGLSDQASHLYDACLSQSRAGLKAKVSIDRRGAAFIIEVRFDSPSPKLGDIAAKLNVVNAQCKRAGFASSPAASTFVLNFAKGDMSPAQYFYCVRTAGLDAAVSLSSKDYQPTPSEPILVPNLDEPIVVGASVKKQAPHHIGDGSSHHCSWNLFAEAGSNAPAEFEARIFYSEWAGPVSTAELFRQVDASRSETIAQFALNESTTVIPVSTSLIGMQKLYFKVIGHDPVLVNVDKPTGGEYGCSEAGDSVYIHDARFSVTQARSQTHRMTLEEFAK